MQRVVKAEMPIVPIRPIRVLPPSLASRAHNRKGDGPFNDRPRCLFSLDPARWSRLSALLDQALDLAADERAGWLDRLRTEDPDAASDLQAMLDDHAASVAARFLTGYAAPDPAGSPGAVDASPAGETLGVYTLERPIGEGGMGSVWLARRSDGRYEGEVAVKLLKLSLIGRAGASASAARARSWRDSRTPTSPDSSMPASASPGSRSSFSSMWRASASTFSAMRTASTSPPA